MRFPKRSQGSRPIGAALADGASIAGEIVRGIARSARAGVGSLAEPTAELRRRLAAGLASASRVITPTRGLLVVALGCALVLALSQFADYRSVTVGAENYSPGIESVAPAPEIDRRQLGSAHAQLILPAALLAIAALLFAVRSGRWKLCRIAALVGVAAVAVAILIDRPAGLDEGALVRDFAGVEAKLLAGFWAELLAGVGLALTSLLLGSELRRRDVSPRRSSRRRPASGTTRKVVGGGAGAGPPGA